MKTLSCYVHPLRIVLITMSVACFGQVQDNFSDGNFTANPTWSGNNSKFEVNTGQLHLNAPALAETAYLSTASNAIHNASWEFYVQMGFATSGTSLTKVYLTSDQADLKQPLNGYFVMIGNTADEVSLYKQTGITITEIIDGLDGRVSFSTVSAKIKVTRDATGNWDLYSDTGSAGPTGTYALEGNVNDLTHTASSFFGVHCTYIASRSALFWFDDFVVTGTPVPDLTPPSVLSVEVVNQFSVLVSFSEAIEQSTSQSPPNYFVNGIGNPISAVLQADSKSVVLTFGTPFTNGLTYTLQISGVQDTDGNAMSLTSTDFLYFVPLPVSKKDIIISEFMADPSPVVGLPESEFVELFNRSSNPVDLQGWKLSDGTTTAVLPSFILMPASRCVIAPTSTASLFSSAISGSNFPSLNNSGDNIILKNSSGWLIDSITYSPTWYHSDEKKDGGWSLEIVDPENLCEEEGNWTASENAQGGTPGFQNSVLASNPDVTAPTIVSGVIESANEITITFNEKLDGNTSISATLTPPINIFSYEYSASLRQIKIITSEAMLPSTYYTLTLSNVFDCPGNALTENTIQLILPEVATAGDVLINEVLFNPKSGGVDFAEIYNQSSKHISLKKWTISSHENNLVVNPKEIEQDNLIIAPKSFLVFTSDPAILKSHYPRTIESVCLATTLPSMPDDEGSIALVDSLGIVLDYFLYRDDYHVIFLKDKEGVSLERVSLESKTNDANNWRSASQAENFATPGYKNSASSTGATSAIGDVTVEPEIFSPQVAPNDFTKITYRFNQSGSVANVSILDQQGHPVKVLANNEVLGTEGFFRWDGDREDGGRARAGYYIAWVEVFDATGKAETFRKRIVIAFH